MGTLSTELVVTNACLQTDKQEPEVTTTSPPNAANLARRLKDAGARMYGAFWCSHCFDQKQAFGKQAMVSFPYVECFPDGFRQASETPGRTYLLHRLGFPARPASCERCGVGTLQGVRVEPACGEAGIEGFPTWIINGKQYVGEQSFDKLEQALATAAEPALAQ